VCSSDLRIRLRQLQRIKVITLNDTLSSSLAVLNALKANELVALLGDRDLFDKGIPVQFFGKTVFFQVILVMHGINLPVLVASVKIRLRSFFV